MVSILRLRLRPKFSKMVYTTRLRYWMSALTEDFISSRAIPRKCTNKLEKAINCRICSKQSVAKNILFRKAQYFKFTVIYTDTETLWHQVLWSCQDHKSSMTCNFGVVATTRQLPAKVDEIKTFPRVTRFSVSKKDILCTPKVPTEP